MFGQRIRRILTSRAFKINTNTQTFFSADFNVFFDTVNHKILINKLEHYGIRGLAKDWFISYLDNRQQSATINNITSSSISIS